MIGGSKKIKPNFLYIGPNKAGSTWIYENLNRHPQVYLSPAKELHYFDIYYHLGEEWYLKHFRSAACDCRIVGEISHDYIYSAEACNRIFADLGKVKLMVCLREPIQRAFSEYLYMVRQGYVRSSFTEAIKKFPVIIEHSLYYENLVRYRDRFGTENLIITKFDDLKANPVNYYANLCKKLDIQQLVPSDFTPRPALSAAAPRNLFASIIAKRLAMGLRKMGMATLITRIKSSAVVQNTLYRRYTAENLPRLGEDEREELKSRFYGDVLDLNREFLPDIAHSWGYR